MHAPHRGVAYCKFNEKHKAYILRVLSISDKMQRQKKKRPSVCHSGQDFLKSLIRNSRKAAKERSDKGRTSAGDFDLSLETLNDMFSRQDGKCYYSGMSLRLMQSSDWQCSIERQNQSLGYVKSNVVLIAAEFQHSSQWSEEKFAEFVKLMNTKHERREEKLVLYKKNRISRRILQKTAIGYVCTRCGIDTPLLNFNKDPNKGCKTCYAKDRKLGRETPRGHFGKILTNIKSSSKDRGHATSTITLDDLFNILNDQGGLCAYTGIPMTFGSYLDKWWTCSIERKDVRTGYTLENVCLICYEFNTVDNRIRGYRVGDDARGSAAWCIDKIQALKQNLFLRSLDDVLSDVRYMFQE